MMMGKTMQSFKDNDPNNIDRSDSRTSENPLNRIATQRNQEGPRERRLSNIANSVSGFYRENSLSDNSKLRSTHESNFA